MKKFQLPEIIQKPECDKLEPKLRIKAIDSTLATEQALSIVIVDFEKNVIIVETEQYELAGQQVTYDIEIEDDFVPKK